jgi:hypothetical protein
MNALLGHLSHVETKFSYTTFKFLTPGPSLFHTYPSRVIYKFQSIMCLYYNLYMSKMNGEVITKVCKRHLPALKIIQ